MWCKWCVAKKLHNLSHKVVVIKVMKHLKILNSVLFILHQITTSIPSRHFILGGKDLTIIETNPNNQMPLCEHPLGNCGRQNSRLREGVPSPPPEYGVWGTELRRCSDIYKWNKDHYELWIMLSYISPRIKIWSWKMVPFNFCFAAQAHQQMLPFYFISYTS